MKQVSFATKIIHLRFYILLYSLFFQILGGEVCLWTEQVDENILDARLWPRSSALGERLWSDPDDENDFAIKKETFKRFSIFRNRLVQLGIKAEPIFPKYCAQNQDECV